MTKRTAFLALALAVCSGLSAQSVKLNDLDYFEDTGVNYLVYSNGYNGMFCDEKTAAVEIILRGVRIATGGGIRLMNTPEQWDIYGKWFMDAYHNNRIFPVRVENGRAGTKVFSVTDILKLKAQDSLKAEIIFK